MSNKLWSSFKTILDRSRIYRARKERTRPSQPVSKAWEKTEEPLLPEASAYRQHESFSLIKSRPDHLEQAYQLTSAAPPIDALFGHIMGQLFDFVGQYKEEARVLGKEIRPIFRERGTLAEKRPYYFLKPGGEWGWLVERSGAGWIISRAEKVQGQDFFLRSSADAWDFVTVYQSSRDQQVLRIKSHRFGGGDLLPPSVYVRKLQDSFGKFLEEWL